MENSTHYSKSDFGVLQAELIRALTDFANSDPDEGRVGSVRNILRLLCRITSSSRATIFERLNESMQAQIDCYDAAAGFQRGEKPLVMASKDFPSWADAAKTGACVLAEDETTAVYSRIGGRSVQTCILLPITYQDRNYGCFVLENPCRETGERVMTVAPLVGTLIGSARANHEAQAKLEELREPTVINGSIAPGRALKVLCKDYTSVYYLDLAADALMPIRVESASNAARIPEVKSGGSLSFEQTMTTYCVNYVTEQDQDAFLHFFDKSTLEERLRDTERFSMRYRCRPNLAGHQFFEAQIIRVSDDPSENQKLLVAFRHIDEQFLVEQRHQQELEEALQKERLSNEILSAISKIYYSIFRIDLEKDFYEEISSDNKVHHLTGKSGRASTEMVELCNTFVVPEYRERILRFFDVTTLADRLQNEDTIANEYLATDGNWHTARFIVKRRSETGRVTHILYVTRLISDTKRREQNWILIAEEANKANAAKTEFISQIAHDIRTPLNAILGFLSITRAHIDDPERVRYGLDKIQVAGDFLHELVDDVLDISRIENGQMKLQPEKISLTRFFNEFPALVEQNQMGKSLQFHYDLHALPQEFVLADPLRLKQIYSNILSNAVKYTPSGGSVTMEIQESPAKENAVCLSVTIRDTGIGMSKEYMDKMYSKFSRETDTRINKVSGYGLGLSIVKQLVDMMGGTIHVESAPGKGTSFRVDLVLPSCQAEVRPAQEENAPDYDSVCKGMHLLVAEDNELNFEVIKEILAMHAITCERAIDGAVCVEKFRGAKPHTFDAILMDMQMPNMNGLEATAAIRKMPVAEAHSIPIIAMTANAFQKDIQNCINAGMTSYLSKPIDTVKLIRELAAAKMHASTN